MEWFREILSRLVMYVRIEDAVSRAKSIATRASNQYTLEFVPISKALRIALNSRQAAVGQINAPKDNPAVCRSVWRAEGGQPGTPLWECSLFGMFNQAPFIHELDRRLKTSKVHRTTLAIEWQIRLSRCTV